MKVITTTVIDRVVPASDSTTDHVPNRVHSAADLLYDAECALHDARQTQVDAWIEAAANKLVGAIAAHLASVVDSGPSTVTGLNH